MKTDIESLKTLYFENRVFNGEYDVSLSAKCSNGTFVGKESDGIIAFKGIPYAKQPLGELRWKRPEKADDSELVYEAYNFGKSPIQTEWPTEVASYYKQGEDCLYLNVWVNSRCNDQNKPVMVFFHGGSYGWGGTSDPLYDGHNFVASHPDIILVTVGYRTGIMGFIDLSYLSGGDKYSDAPNLGLLDQIESLRWINRNISSFGGNKDNVTIFGESAGGGSVSLLPIIEESHGLYKRVICESGSVALTFSKEECKYFTDLIIEQTGAKSVDDLLRLNESELVTINKKVNQYNNFPQRDGKLIPENPYIAYEQGKTKDIDIMIGTNANEMNYWVGELGGIVAYRFSMPIKFENDINALSPENKAKAQKFISGLKGHSIWRISEFYNELLFRLPAVKQAEEHRKNGGRTYMYYWTEPSTMKFRKACHAVELAYVFNNLDETIYTGDRGDEKLARIVQNMWTNFARTGDPSTEEIKWKEYDSLDRETMVLEKDVHMEKDVLKKQRELLFNLIYEFITMSTSSIHYNVPFVRKAIFKILIIILIIVAAIVLGGLFM